MKVITVKLVAGLMLLVMVFLAACSSPAATTTTVPVTTKPPTAAAPGTTAPATIVPATTAPAVSTTPLKTWKLKMSYEQANTSFYHLWGHQPFADKVKEVTKGRVTLDLYPSQTLLKSADSWQGVKTGITDVAWAFTGLFPGQFELIEAINLPFVVPNAAVGSRVAWDLYTGFPEIQKQFEGVKVLTIWTAEPHYYVSNKKFLKTMDDFKGMKVRASGGPPTELMKNMGASPMLFGMPDVYMNLQKGVIDVAQCSSESYLGYRLYEVAKYVTFVPAVANVHFLIMNQSVWDSFPKDVQDQLTSISGQTGAVFYGEGVYEKSRQVLPDEIKKAGFTAEYYTVPPDELQKWVTNAAIPTYTDWLAKMKGKGSTSAQQIFDQIPVLVKKYSAK